MKKRVLVIEDDPTLQPVLTQILKRAAPRVEVEWVESAEAAWVLLRKRHFDLVIADILLEGHETGLDFWLSCEACYPTIPVILMSGIPPHDFLNAIGKDHIVPPFLEKPLRPGTCAQIIEGWLKEGWVH
jgi:DNA-binding NtrC family response regulator